MKSVSFRWLWLLPFVIGSFVSLTLVELSDGLFLVMNLLSMLSCALLLGFLRRPVFDSLWAWIFMFVFLIGYYAKTYYVASGIDAPGYAASLNPEWHLFTAETLLDGFVWITYAFCMFCITAIWMLRRPGRRPSPLPAQNISRFAVIVTLVTTLLISVAFAIVRVRLNIGIMGAETVHLPLGIDTLIFRSQSALIPAVLTLLIWVTDSLPERSYWLLSLLVLFAHFLTLSLISSSKGGIINFLVAVFAVWLLAGRFTKMRRLFVVVLAACGVIFFILVAQFRAFRLSGSGIVEGLSQAALQSTDVSLGDGPGPALFRVASRVTGAEGVWFAVLELSSLSQADRFQAILSQGVSEYFTRNVVGVTWLADFRAPGLVGALMLFGGLPAVLVGMVVVVVIVATIWRRLQSLRSSVGVMSYSAMFLLVFITDGNFQIQDVIAYVAAVILCEFLFRQFLTRRSAGRRARDLVAKHQHLAPPTNVQDATSQQRQVCEFGSSAQQPFQI